MLIDIGILLKTIDGEKMCHFVIGARETDKALQMLRLEGFDGERLGVPNIVILLTDGSSTNPFLTGRAADELKQYGVEVFAVGKDILSIFVSTVHSLIYNCA